MRSICLHAGQFKTGSSYIQSSLAASADTLLADGIFYPKHGDVTAIASGRISSGNGFFLRTEEGVAQLPKMVNSENVDYVLISSEFFSYDLSNIEFIAKIKELLPKIGVEHVFCLIYIRDPVEHAASEYQQIVKRSGYSGTIEEHFYKYEMPKLIAKIIRNLRHDPIFSLEIKNYRNYKSDILASLAEWLNIGCDRLQAPPVSTINRSLTNSELYLQKVINQKIGSDARFLADALCQELPLLRRTIHYPSADVQRAMLEKNMDHIAYVNRVVRKGEEYDTSLRISAKKDSGERIGFSKEQVKVIGETIGNKIKELQEELRRQSCISAHHVGEQRRLTGKTEEAELYFDRALQHDSDYVPSLLAKAKILIQRDRRDSPEVFRILEHLERVAPEHAGLRALKAEIKINNG